MHETTLILIEVGALIFALGLVSWFSHRAGLSPIPFYLIIGLLLGEGSLIPLSASEEFIEIGSEIGVILLLAMLGLEYSAQELLTNLKRSRWAGVLDALMNALPGAAFALILGWGPIAALVLAGITWISSSGVIAKLLVELGRLSNRETPTILSILVIEDLAMAFYLPILSAVLIGAGWVTGSITVVISVFAVSVILFLSLRFSDRFSRLFDWQHAESLLLGVFGLTLLVAGIAQQLNVSAAVGAFLVGIALSGRVAQSAQKLLSPLRDLFAAFFFLFFGLSTNPADLLTVWFPALILAVITMATKTFSGYRAAASAGIGVLGRWRTGLTLTPRGEFSIIIAGLAVASGVEPLLAPLATAYVLMTVLAGPMLARMADSTWFTQAVTAREKKRRNRLAGETS
jgi:CPA2 family monovalent cation:H+ antiporter-2